MKLGLIKLYLLLFYSLLFTRNPDAVGENGVVVSSHELASKIGLGVLKNGGNLN